MNGGPASSLWGEVPGEVEHTFAVHEGQDRHQDAPAPHPLADDPQLAAWDVDSGSESDDSLGDDFDMYKDFNNQAQEPGVKSRPVTVYAEGAIPPLSMRPKSGPLLQVPSTVDVHTSFYDTSLAHESRFSTGECSSGLFDRDTKTFRPLIPNDSQWELDDRAPLGAEYTDMEREQMTRAYRRFYWRNKFLGKIDSWLRGYNPLGGWLGPQIAVILTVIVLALIGVGLFFVIPRVPDVSIVTNNPLTPMNGNKTAMALTGFPTGFQMNGTLHVRLDNPGWIPAHILSLATTVKALDTNVIVAKGDLSKQWVPGRKVTTVDVDLAFSHKSLNVTGDATQLLFQDACAHLYQGTDRPTLNLHVEMVMDVGGLVGKHPSSSDLRSLACPWELPQ
ncbi:Uncharacterized protein MSYG_1857 [Malassezia sympodialis ATCC 42132]|uniref:Uncharacterized protein n=1 Tax=Malassezia sympodialis (strain ATCC 42132) TaxID=1230383 RepID=A0A1M8A5B1_MALS4|nr:Uncharacterized protein MSYG_1857 [Malassezia sympodialis ATCC 42132]